LARAGFVLKGEGDFPKGVALSQQPTPPTTATPGSPVTVVFGKGNPSAQVPLILGLDVKKAQALLAKAGLVFIPVGDPSQGVIAGQTPAPASKAQPGSAVVVFFGKAPLKVKVPSLAGLNSKDAEQRLRQAGLWLAGKGDPTNALLVTQQTPKAGTEV